jgi:TFIIF-interacting CTD phosphatase-like protein
MHGTKVLLPRAVVNILENAIPIEGWISDPTDNDLLHLIPFLKALRFVGDVRSLLGLRTGARRR